MTEQLTAEVEVDLEPEPWQLRDAIQLAVFTLFDTRDPDTAHVVEIPPLNPWEEPRQVERINPYDFDLSTFTLETIHPATPAEHIRIVASCTTR